MIPVDLYKPNSFIRNKIEHHIKYVETHGFDETEWVTISEHSKINHRVLFSMVTSKQLAKISSSANQRTEKAKYLKVERIRHEIAMTPTTDDMRMAKQKRPFI